MLPPTLRELCRDRQRRPVEIEHRIGEVEPDVLPAPDLSRKKDQPRNMIGTPRRELMELHDRQRATAPRRGLDRLDLEDCFVDTLSATLRIVQNALEELELVLCGTRMLAGAREDRVFDFRAAQRYKAARA